MRSVPAAASRNLSKLSSARFTPVLCRFLHCAHAFGHIDYLHLAMERTMK